MDRGRRIGFALIALAVGSAAAVLPAPVAAQTGSGFVCTEIVGFSQTESWYRAGFISSVSNPGAWQLRWFSGGSIDQWADHSGGFTGWDSRYLVTQCAQNSSRPDRVVLNVSGDYRNDPGWWAQQTSLAIDNVHKKYANVRQIVLQPVVGGPAGGQCQYAGKVVRATYNFAYIQQGLARLVGGDVVTGPAPTVRTCADFADDVGHLVQDGRVAVGQSIAQSYASAGPAPAPGPQPVPAPGPPAVGPEPVPAPPAPVPVPALVGQSGAAFCERDQAPNFAFGFATLSQLIGEAMGGPTECEHGNPENGDTLQQTTTGLAFYRSSTNTPTFTDGFLHWALTPVGLVSWTGPNSDPP
jgi:hypothetical protein